VFGATTALVRRFLAGGMAALLGPAPHALEWNSGTLLGFTLLLGVLDDSATGSGTIWRTKVPALWAFPKGTSLKCLPRWSPGGCIAGSDGAPVFRSPPPAHRRPALYFFVSEGKC